MTRKRDRRNTGTGLYHPDFEHDACGVGLICRISGRPSHDIVESGLQILNNLDHRGARGADPKTGDGAGILTQMPDRFLRAAAAEAETGFDLPPAGRYGVGMLFLPQDEAMRDDCRDRITSILALQGLEVIGWRHVPTNNACLGATARAMEPAIWQVFIRHLAVDDSIEEFERLLFAARRAVEKELCPLYHRAPDSFYVATLSSRTIVYKGMLTTEGLRTYYPDLTDPAFESALALVHSRFSTNTLPEWRLAQPFRYLCHNGEINTLRGNLNWMEAREACMTSDLFRHSRPQHRHSRESGNPGSNFHPSHSRESGNPGTNFWIPDRRHVGVRDDHSQDISHLFPLLARRGSDSQALDNALEFLALSGRSLPKSILTLIPEAWERDEEMDPEKRAFYQFSSCTMEAWDGPAVVPFTDGRYIGAVLDRNGLRPGRYVRTADGRLILASEAGVMDLDDAEILEKGRLKPGQMLLADLEEQRIISDYEIKNRVASGKPYRQWVEANLRKIDDVVAEAEAAAPDSDDVSSRGVSADDLPQLHRVFGYSLEDLKFIVGPMGESGKPPIGSMGNDTPLAVLSRRPRLLFDYFKQLFAQVTNPPLDAIREELVTSTGINLGPKLNLLEETEAHARQIRCESPVLSDREFAAIRDVGKGEGRREKGEGRLRSVVLAGLFEAAEGAYGLEAALETLCFDAAHAVREDGATILILSDRGHSPELAPIPSLLAAGAVHHHLLRSGLRGRCSIVVDCGDAREVHHFCLLVGFGVSAIHPYVALATARNETAYREAVRQGVLKVMSKMGISTLQSYCGAQIFEAVGLAQDLVDRYFTGVPSRLGGIGLEVIAAEVLRRHTAAYRLPADAANDYPDVGGLYQWRANGEHHVLNPTTVAKLQHAVRSKSDSDYQAYAESVSDSNREIGTIRGLLDFDPTGREPVPIEEVEPWTSIVRRFKTGAMSYGSISEEAHETLAVAMNRIGGKSNTGEGGESPDRYGAENPRRSRIKQIASGRFGVTIDYLSSADEIQIKMAQGAKPGEGGQLPGKKVLPWIAETRHSTPYVGLISPPPHHDIYSIEDLAQLIFDLKNANPTARVSVKLVSEVGVGTIAAGVAKAKADTILISGHDGGTGASPLTSLMHAGLPWELGLSETHQTLTMKGLRRRVRIECDGQLKTGRDVAIAALLGADEFGFATAPLVSMGCIMMRKCHLNTCPVGIATQDPNLRQKFAGRPEHVINFFYFVATELREIMAALGFRTLQEMVGRSETLRTVQNTDHWKARHLNLNPILEKPAVPDILAEFDVEAHHLDLSDSLDANLIERARPAIERGAAVEVEMPVSNRNRTLGTLLSHEISRRRGADSLRDDQIRVTARGSAGQSCGAFLAKGVTIDVVGEVNDYCGKGLSGGRIIVRPGERVTYIPNMNIIAGNVMLYGATSGEAFVRGQAGERFGVRNSGAAAVVEGVGDHGCEYMTGGRVVVLGPTGRNFAAGMSGGIAYVMDGTREFRQGRCNLEMVDLLPVEEPEDIDELFKLIEKHVAFTDSDVGRWVIDHWAIARHHFVKVYPTEYRLALERLVRESMGADGSSHSAA